ncbi:thiamine-phosphate kinase [Amycolatopsis orientalis]|uniref:Thiamine-monophosphate kinase n=1 Tax=Amycolatopsis orientalis TaxID=31958 RepID=A0A193C0K3_AMYOR|nr:thiamine-phosphate kinase [Amycolatopsis orientalis]ANN18041.1 thiamine-phosphate kinase [Amycolatopsis orientalis]
MSAENFSDEPTRLAETIVPLFARQAGAFTPVAAPDGSRVELITGADDQDDCAVFRLTGNHDLVVGTDYVRGPKFRLYEMGHLDEYDLGYYLVAANLSDIAAMGAKPIGLLSVVRYPAEMDDVLFGFVMKGIHDACAAFGCPNVGGDIGGAERLILAASALGVCPAGGALLRSGAKPGDVVCLTAPTGLAGAAMAYLRAGIPDPVIEGLLPSLLANWKRPVARIGEGLALAASGVVRSCQDTSDGLKATLLSIADLSGVGIAVDERAVPVPGSVAAVAAHVGVEPLALVLGDSVDFELVFTVPPCRVDELAESVDFHRIGEVVEEQEVVLVGEDGSRAALPGKAWRHQGGGDGKA